MMRIFRHPATNAICISILTAFYSLIFIFTAGHAEFRRMLYYAAESTHSPFWGNWSAFLAAGHHRYIAWAMITVTLLIVILPITRRRLYDEYHTAILTQCLSVAIVLTMIAIALFYLAILSDANGIVEKFTFFAALHWVTMVLADLVYILLCRWR
ncbi:MAG TPA: hypothetical protein VN366_12980 [Feifaniaceae bacterium]|nr:hypothetical protein [Feifaniaceae bacterium]